MHVLQWPEDIAIYCCVSFHKEYFNKNVNDMVLLKKNDRNNLNMCISKNMIWFQWKYSKCQFLNESKLYRFDFTATYPRDQWTNSDI